MSVYGVKSFRAQKIKEQRTLNFNFIFFKHLKVKKRFLRQKLAWTYQIKCNFWLLVLQCYIDGNRKILSKNHQRTTICP